MKRKTYLENLFTKDTRQKLVILEILFDNPKGIRIEELAEKSSLVRQTIYRCLEEIKSISSNNDIDGDIILRHWNYFFEGDEVAYFKLLALISESEPIVTLAKIFLEKKHISFSQFCVDNFIGESTLRRYIGRGNKFLSSLGLRVSVVQDELLFIGEEKRIRFCLISFLWRIYRGATWPFETISKKEVGEVLSILFPGNRSIHYGKKNQVSFYIAVYLLRIRSKQYISAQALPQYSKDLIKNSNVKFEMLEKFIYNFRIPPVEIDFLLLSLYNFPECYEQFQSTGETLKVLKEQSPKSFYSIQHFIGFIKNKHPGWNEKNSSNKYFMPMLLSARIFFDTFQDIYFNSSAINVFRYSYKKFPNLLPNIKDSILKFEPNLSPNQVKSLSMRYAQAYVLEFEPYDFEPEIKILLDTDVPLYADKIIKERISNLLFSRYNFKIKTTSFNFRPDIIITTGVFDNIYEDTELLYISPEVNKRDADRLLEICEKVLRKNITNN